ncbi:hypothetical protein [Flagellimonas marinaquae]
MKLVSIFDDHLYAAHFDKEEDNEWDRLLEQWGDVEYLNKFAKDNGIADKELFIDNITEQADYLDDLLEELQEEGLNLDSYFRPLDDFESKEVILSKRKGKQDKGTIRLYAIKIDTNCYVVTGGAIKMTHKMKDHPETAKELPKLDKVRNYLMEQDIIDYDSFFEYLEQDQ